MVEILEDIIDRPIKSANGPECFIKIEWNRQTQKLFDRGRKPKQGGRYVFKCIRFNGKNSFFTLERL